MVKVGDIVKTKDKSGKKIVLAAVIKVSVYKRYDLGAPREVASVNVIFPDGEYGNRGYGKYTETGHHIDIQCILDSIK